MESNINSNNKMFRHIIATLSYRAAKTLRNTPENFAAFRIDSNSRTSIEILSHVGDLMDWALSMAKDWESVINRFYKSIKIFDSYLADNTIIACPLEKLFQGPIADAFTHVGQLAMLRRIAGAPIRGENCFVADIVTGRVRLEQSKPRKEFD